MSVFMGVHTFYDLARVVAHSFLIASFPRQSLLRPKRLRGFFEAREMVLFEKAEEVSMQLLRCVDPGMLGDEFVAFLASQRLVEALGRYLERFVRWFAVNRVGPMSLVLTDLIEDGGAIGRATCVDEERESGCPPGPE